MAFSISVRVARIINLIFYQTPKSRIDIPDRLRTCSRKKHGNGVETIPNRDLSRSGMLLKGFRLLKVSY